MKEFKTIRYSTPWYVDDYHLWKDVYVGMNNEYKFNNDKSRNIINKDSHVTTIGSCFAHELGSRITGWGMKGSGHPPPPFGQGVNFYTTTAVKQEIQRAFGGWKEYDDEPIWEVSDGYVHPFNNYYKTYNSKEELLNENEIIKKVSAESFKSADIIIITLGLIEAYKNPQTGNVFRNIPHPEMMDKIKPEFFRLSTKQMREDLEEIRKVIRDNSSAEIILTVSPIPLHNTFTNKDVRIANSESKSRIRSVVSEFVEDYPDIHYFHSYEMVTDHHNKFDCWKGDCRHVHSHTVDWIMSEFLEIFADESISVPFVEKDWLKRVCHCRKERGIIG